MNPSTSFIHNCPSCGYSADIKSTRPHDAPEPALNDIILCGNCGHIAVLVQFVEDVRTREQSAVFRPMTELEFAVLPEDVSADLSFAVRNIKAAKENKNGN